MAEKVLIELRLYTKGSMIQTTFMPNGKYGFTSVCYIYWAINVQLYWREEGHFCDPLVHPMHLNGS